MILRTAVINATIGVQQESLTSCFLFALVVNDLIRNLKERCAPDGFLGWLHSLMLMDDTIILATSRQRAIEKIGVLREFSRTSGMIINKSKTQFMVINGEEDDRNPIIHDDLNITNCDMYTYFGARFTQDGRLTSSVKAQVAAKMCHVVKFEAFDAGTPAFKYTKALLDNTDTERINATRERVLSSKRSKFVTYRTLLNPALTTHPIYADPTVCEY
ncbi:hypothetical protein CAPTEDRAFT_194054 [Capitella teleta]|uniref:Reverse transcriptase domain-containing protein n=1 Tax=Capitella teleta TaxID=283909 RepID=R7UWE2_CAPTE|nr:hypothetical protein CAPTEDRAFT_194054 [Capitella teleta]|eukprot:ELU10587.1 hypothetical protein CAPTEDRAFT_194054 [Capitella teleta]